MTLLAAGIIAFIGLHLIPYFGTSFRSAAIEKFGKNAYRGMFALLVLVSFGALILGWRSTLPAALYDPPIWGYEVPPIVMVLAFILFFSSQAPTNIRRFVRHPQMTGVFLWASAHLFANGETRSVLLFGSFALWAVIAMWAANRRDGDWIKPDKQPFFKDVITVLIGLVGYSLFVFFHEAIIGVAPLLSFD